MKHESVKKKGYCDGNQADMRVVAAYAPPLTKEQRQVLRDVLKQARDEHKPDPDEDERESGPDDPTWVDEDGDGDE